MEQVDYDYHTDPLFHAAVVAVTRRELYEQYQIRREIWRELRGY
jgi:hypothetical protein